MQHKEGESKYNSKKLKKCIQALDCTYL